MTSDDKILALSLARSSLASASADIQLYIDHLGGNHNSLCDLDSHEKRVMQSVLGAAEHIQSALNVTMSRDA